VCWLGLYTVYLVIMSMENPDKSLFFSYQHCFHFRSYCSKDQFCFSFLRFTIETIYYKSAVRWWIIWAGISKTFFPWKLTKSQVICDVAKQMLTCCVWNINVPPVATKTMLSITVLFHYARRHYARCRILFIVMLNVVMLHAIVLSLMAPKLL
jgi:hypothetical protein